MRVGIRKPAGFVTGSTERTLRGTKGYQGHETAPRRGRPADEGSVRQPKYTLRAPWAGVPRRKRLYARHHVPMTKTCFYRQYTSACSKSNYEQGGVFARNLLDESNSR